VSDRGAVDPAVAATHRHTLLSLTPRARAKKNEIRVGLWLNERTPFSLG